MTKERLKTFFCQFWIHMCRQSHWYFVAAGLDIRMNKYYWKTLEEKDVDLKIIPPKTTKYAQPLELYFFRQYKITYMPREQQTLLNYVPITCSQNCTPFFIMKLHNVIYNQLSVRKHINQCFVTRGWTLATILVNLWITLQVSLSWRSAFLLYNVQLWHVITLLFFTVRFVVIHIALSILLTEKDLKMFFRHPHTHTCIYEDI